MEYVNEINPLKRAWIWFWYNDVVRFLVILIPTYFVVVIPLLFFVGVPPKYMGNTLSLIYMIGCVWAMLDNDYSNLRRIGLDEYRKPLK
mgnify:CR=1 FL=1